MIYDIEYGMDNFNSHELQKPNTLRWWAKGSGFAKAGLQQSGLQKTRLNGYGRITEHLVADPYWAAANISGTSAIGHGSLVETLLRARI